MIAIFKIVVYRDYTFFNLFLFLSVLKMSEKPLAALDFDFKIC